MKKTSLALIVAITAFSSMAANAVEGKAAGTNAAANSTGLIVAGSVAAGAAIAGAVVVSNSSDGNPVTTSNSNTTGTN
ncbi:hypothetical protein ACRN9F_01040 [Shewanella oncorhynchi]|uniref:hypothetical protein n=1 Tax=Shewanella oncorhynchi TaxID=2726434 RepID=UPI003D7A44CA